MTDDAEKGPDPGSWGLSFFENTVNRIGKDNLARSRGPRFPLQEGTVFLLLPVIRKFSIIRMSKRSGRGLGDR